MLESALCAGLCSQGVDVRLTGILPTPGVAWLTVQQKALAGAVISASHNPFADNGIKFFGSDGYKLEESCEDLIEKEMAEPTTVPLSGAALGRVYPWQEGAFAYRDFLVREGAALTRLKLVLDCANGAASYLAPAVFSALGAEVIPLFAEPDGVNINEGCGSTHPEALAEHVVRVGAAAGLAFDGDADRLIVVDERGQILDGDYIMAICALAMQAHGALTGNAVVVTVMSNIGFYHAMRHAGITVTQTAVGDRHVTEALRSGGGSLGGEQSGHIVFPQRHTTGDGILTALELLRAVTEQPQPLSELAQCMQSYPQVLLNTAGDSSLLNAPAVQEQIHRVEEFLKDEGRIFVRASGTEPLVRVMLEGREEAELLRLAQATIAVIDECALRAPQEEV
jgi:phosphoglucosamine mutase